VSVAAPVQSESVGYVALVRQNRKFRLLWTGQIVSLLGDWFDLIASASLIAILTKSGTAVGGLFVVRMLAPFIISPVAGVAADRYNRKRLLIATDLSRGLTVLGFLLVRHPGDVWLVYVLTALQMGMSGFFFPTRNAILPDITTSAELGAANALSASTWSVMLAFGAALGGLASGTFGVYPSFVLDAVSFFTSALLISRIVYTPPSTSHLDDRTVRAALRQYGNGLRYLRDHRDIFFIALNKSANSLFVAGAFQVFQVTISERVFVIGESGGISLGLMYAAVGIGTGVGPIIIRDHLGVLHATSAAAHTEQGAWACVLDGIRHVHTDECDCIGGRRRAAGCRFQCGHASGVAGHTASHTGAVMGIVGVLWRAAGSCWRSVAQRDCC
jgi:MFS family permease